MDDNAKVLKEIAKKEEEASGWKKLHEKSSASGMTLDAVIEDLMPRKLRVVAHKRRGFPNLAAAVPACIARGRCVAASSFPNAATKDAVRASAASAATKYTILRPFRENRALWIISGLQNFDRSNVASVVTTADKVWMLHFCMYVPVAVAGRSWLRSLAGSERIVDSAVPSYGWCLQKDPIAGESEGLAFEFNICEAVASWEQVRKSTTILTKEYIDALPNGWEEYAWRRINKGILLNKCRNITLCMEKLSLVLPDTSPYVPQQFGSCAVVQSSTKPPPVLVPAFTEVPLSVPAAAGPNLRRRILRRPSHDASAAAFFPTPSRDASTPSTTSYPSYDHQFPTLMDVTLVVGAREKGAACVDGTPPRYHWLPGFWDGSDKWLLHLELCFSVGLRGGSWSRNLTWCTQCKETNLGSSDHMETRAQFVGILRNDALQNPDFYNWNKVKVRYCDGAHVY
ncbi:uncharacterized protein LOC123425900 [Hordeum vulgare subsp. vulgare]|uniref:uncharacterized protein LOC123425900 n=1 Tax=Hordeum vulgare subsp. vulgare TaxID=112509 RepID=UPI001D1A4EC8|nr:uncharacterized protein LOC123425900 [Hordeum vulgare subsp. vulgare]